MLVKKTAGLARRFCLDIFSGRVQSNKTGQVNFLNERELSSQEATAKKQME
jgi:hypothetical protein